LTDDGLFGIGGHVQLVTVTRDRITTQILKRWLDARGEKIDTTRVR
jgi:hypothetical protein